MKRFYTDVSVHVVPNGFQVMLDGRPVKTQLGHPQIAPSQRLAEALASEWAAQGEEINKAALVYRDLIDYALDIIAPDPSETITKLLHYGETDTLLYRAPQGEALHRRQNEMWEPITQKIEGAYAVTFARIMGVIHSAQPAENFAKIRAQLDAIDVFTLAALYTMSSLSASLIIGLSALNDTAEAEALWNAANLEEDFQAELWGHDADADAIRRARAKNFTDALNFLRLAQI